MTFQQSKLKFVFSVSSHFKHIIHDNCDEILIILLNMRMISRTKVPTQILLNDNYWHPRNILGIRLVRLIIYLQMSVFKFGVTVLLYCFHGCKLVIPVIENGSVVLIVLFWLDIDVQCDVWISFVFLFSYIKMFEHILYLIHEYL